MTESKWNLGDETIECLQDLLQVNHDSAQGFREAADQIDDRSLRPIFRDYAFQRDRNVGELGAYVTLNGEEAEREGSFAAKVHRSWMTFRSALTNNNRQAMLEEAARGEEFILHAYEAALTKTAESAIHGVLTRQHVLVKTTHDAIVQLRDAAE